MEVNVSAIKSPSRQRRKTPDWATWRQRRNCSLKDAVALCLDIHPAALASLKKNNSVKYRKYLARLKTAGLETYELGAITVIPHHPGSGNEPGSQVVSLASFVAYAMDQESWRDKLPAEFVKLKDVHDKAPYGPEGGSHITGAIQSSVKQKAPVKFVAALIEVLVTMAKLAQKLGLGDEFVVTALPGTKEDFRAVAVKLSSVIDGLQPRTFDDYLDHLCKFKSGARSGDFYQKLLHEHLK